MWGSLVVSPLPFVFVDHDRQSHLTERQDHPATNRPVFFIHPCQTAEVMAASVGGQNITAYDYLLIWVGALGKFVGLDVPMSLIDTSQKQDES
jgi:hypothetical protein